MNMDLCINPVLAEVEEYKTSSKYHLCQRKQIRKRSQSKFSFHFVTLEQTMEEVTLLSDKKASRNSDIPVKIIKEN